MQFADLMLLRPQASSSGFRTLAVLILACAAPMSWAQPAAAPAAASAPAGAVTFLGQATSQRLTVEELLRADAEAALRRLRSPAAPTGVGAAPSSGAAMPEPAVAASSFLAGLPSGAREPAGDGLMLEAIYGVRGPDGDTRVVQVSHRGRSHTLAPGQEIAGVARLVQIKVPCASFLALPDSATQSRPAKRPAKAQKAQKLREACIEQSPDAATVTSAMPVNLLSAQALPSPVQPVPPPQPVPQLTQPVFSARN
jgi:hypothetical protein